MNHNQTILGIPSDSGFSRNALVHMICRELVNLLDGKVEVKNELSNGTIFTVTLPAQGVGLIQNGSLIAAVSSGMAMCPSGVMVLYEVAQCAS